MGKNKTLTSEELVFTASLSNKNEVFMFIANQLLKQNYVSSEELVFNSLNEREQEMSTGLSGGIAIPHGMIDSLSEPKIVVIRTLEPINWNSLDNKPVNLIIAILVPKDISGRKDHFEILTRLSESLIKKEVRNNLLTLPAKEVAHYINNQLIKKDEVLEEVNLNIDNQDTIGKPKKQIRVVGVTTCVTGVAHTFMAAKSLEVEGKKRGWIVHIEKQGQMTKDLLNEQDIIDADFVIIAKSKGIDQPERFNGKLVYETDVAQPITNAAKAFDEMLEGATIQAGDSSSSTSKVTARGKGQKEKPMQHLLTGISYMIPYIAMAGITLGLTTAFGFSVQDDGTFGPNSPIAYAFNTLAGMAFTLYIPILAMFIAYSISGRKAMAPAAILALTLNVAPMDVTIGGTDYLGVSPFFNWQTLSFSGFEHSTSLGFLGAVASGYMIGYGIRYTTVYTDKIDIQAFQTILPLLLIPLFWTIVPWLFMAFFGYLPLYWFGVGMGAFVEILIDANLLWIAGGLMGAMICFDLGGPVNKIAMAIGVAFLTTNPSHPEINGICALAVAVPPTVLMFSMFFHKFTSLKMDEDDMTAAGTASIMGFFGITEGAIPFAAKEPKKWMPSFIIAGAVGGILMSFTGIGDNVAMWGGPIIWVAGGFSNTNVNAQASNWGYTAIYFIPLLVAGFTGFIVASLLDFIYSDKFVDSKIAKSWHAHWSAINKIVKEKMHPTKSDLGKNEIDRVDLEQVLEDSWLSK
ncbi:MAG: hypothetical protein GQ557_00685 [Mycoplasmataceae bacterium]|nr:hypothetical protein [Mycoplasmataceae bacterium]